MAEESISLPVSPKSAEADKCNLRRNSTGKGSSSKSTEKILPHYLRASTGSCHDFCKYGRKHVFEEKVNNPLLRRLTKKQPDNQNSIESLPEKERTSMIKLTARPKTSRPDVPEVIKWEMPTKSVDSRTPVTNVVTEKKTSTGLLMKLVDRKSPGLRVGKTKTSVGRQVSEATESHSLNSCDISAAKKTSTPCRKKTPAGSNAHASQKIIEQNAASSGKKLDVSLRQTLSKAGEANSPEMRRHSFMSKLSSDVSDASNGRRISDVNLGQRMGTSKLAVKKAQAAPRASLSPTTSVSGRAKILVASPRSSSSLRTSVSGRANVQVAPRASASSKISRTRSLNANKHGDLKVVSLEKKIEKTGFEQPEINNDNPNQLSEDLKEPNNNMVCEKTLYVINMENEGDHLETDHVENFPADSSPPPLLLSKSPPLPKSPSSTSHNEEEEEVLEYTETDTEDGSMSEYDEMDLVEEMETMEQVENGEHKNVAKVPAGDTNGQAVKLHFRRGKVIDIHAENSGPRRLKFRRGRVLCDDQNPKGESRRSFRRKGADGGADDDKSDSEKVVLRHQGVQEKRDANGLSLNNVIEETASKLVETRKSKVKALVGAFETVISLQDGKPSANNNAS